VKRLVSDAGYPRNLNFGWASKSIVISFLGLVLWFLLLPFNNAIAGDVRDQIDRSISVQDIHGEEHFPLKDLKAGEASVFFFAMHDCPISNAYTPEIKRVAKEFTPQGFHFYFVYVDPTIPMSELKKHFKEYQHGSYPALIDARHRVINAVGAKMTPEVAVVDAKGRVRYLGRIDNLYAGLGKKRRKATVFDLRHSLETFAKGQPVLKPWPNAVGCYIPPLD
jgi:hypothetical protein